jgi:hypothetical protein
MATADNMANLLVSTNGDPDLRVEGMKLFREHTLLAELDEQANQTFILFKDMSCLLTSGAAIHSFDSPLEVAESDVRLSKVVHRVVRAGCLLLAQKIAEDDA